MFGGGKMDPQRKNVHQVLVRSYFATFVFFILGALLDLLFDVNFLDTQSVASVGLWMILLGTILIVWAQRASHHFKKENLTAASFALGPYRLTRHPTYFGLYLLLLGFGLMMDAFYILILTVISFFVTKHIYLKQEEELLTEKYGEPYREYKSKVRL